MLKRASRFLIPGVLSALLIVALACAYLVVREQKTLSILLGKTGPEGTEVYGRWLTLAPGVRISPKGVLAELHTLDYVQTPEMPKKAGEYFVRGQEMTIYARGYRFPDKEFPAQTIRLAFDPKGLERVAFISGQAVDEWRLEPKRLAKWSSDASTRIPVKLSELPPYVPQAVLAIEDKRFYEHGAIDALGVARALVVDMRRGKLRQGASTISQQLARSIFLDVNRTWRRKVLEAGLAFYLEARYSKATLLEMYLNQVYWGQDGSESLLGIESASRAYFGKPARQLTPAEAALLAGMLQSPNRLSPRTGFKLASARSRVVLGLMREQGRLTPEQFRVAMAEHIRVAPSDRRANDAAYFLARLHDELADRYSLPVLLSEGWKIYTTLDPAAQRIAQAQVATLASSKLKFGEESEQGALVALDPRDGAIRAWVGGTGYQTNPFDRAGDAKRQPGSAYKPFVALAALESRRFTTATLLDDKPLTVKIDDKQWSPQNYDRRFRGSVSLWDSLVNSWNVPLVRLATAVGPERVVDAGHRAGIESPLRAVPSLALGTSEVSVLELTQAYAALANGGNKVQPYDVQQIVGADGTVIELHDSTAERVFDPAVVYLVNQMLSAVLTEGTAKAARAMGLTIAAAGKTGTSENYQDAWFVGFTPDLVTGVWVGYDRPRSLGRSAAGIALPIWVGFMQQTLSHLPEPVPARAPEGITEKTVDLDSGLLVRSGCTRRRQVAFLSGTEPTQDCPLHAGGILGFFKRLTGGSSSSRSSSSSPANNH